MPHSKNLDLLIEKALKNTITNIKDLTDKLEHEKVIFINDKETGLKAIIAIHNTSLGPAIGDTRVLNYKTDREALEDVLKLSKDITYKAAINGLNIGGGNAIIIGDPATIKTPKILKKFGEYVNELQGKFISRTDINTTPTDLSYINETTSYVIGLNNKSGVTSPFTAYSVLQGIKASAFYLWGSEDLKDKKIVIQGLGKVGTYIVDFLTKEQAILFVTDTDTSKIEKTIFKYKDVTPILPEEIYTFEADILVPCALGGILNQHTIPVLNYKLIAGAANNQLQNEELDSQLLEEHGILLAPDFLINTGSLINDYYELTEGNNCLVQSKIDNIYLKTLETYFCANQKNIPPYLAAKQIAEEHIQQVQIRKN